MPSRPRHPEGPQAQSVATGLDVVDPLSWVLAALVSGLIFIRWWQPTEGTAQGDTLGVALGWFVALALMGWIGLRGTSWKLRLDGLQWAVWLLVGGHVLSGCLVLATAGDKRAALNFVWEWLALGVAFPLLRAVLGSSTARREWTVVALGAVLTLSAYGLIQRTYLYSQTIAEYRQVRDDLDDALQTAEKEEQKSQAISYQTQARIQKLQGKLMRQGLQPHMLTGSSRAMLEGRLLHSTEVLGRFALANTFAGLLLVWFVILTAQTLTQIQSEFQTTEPAPNLRRATNAPNSGSRRPLLKVAFLLVCTALVGYCLLLTKSRTAYLGTMSGLGLWTILLGLRSRPRGKKVLFWCVVALLATVSLVVVAGVTGGLDRLVLAEAPKSLQYRLEYWWSSLQTILESPLWGVGPGQFRQHYLVHKLPHSSEEIADPHNLILDVWANGGIVALAGLIWLALELFRTLLAKTTSAQVPTVAAENRIATAAHSKTPQRPTGGVIPIGSSVREAGGTPVVVRKIRSPAIPRSPKPERTGIGIPSLAWLRSDHWRNPLRFGALLSLVVLWLAGWGLETTLWMLLAGWVASVVLLDNTLPQLAPRTECWLAASCGLLVHLLGAGGVAMPVITQLALLSILFSQTAESLVATPEVKPQLKSDLNESPAGVDEHQLAAASQRSAGRNVTLSGIRGGIVVVLGLALFGVCFATAIQPVWLCQAALEQGDFANSVQKREQFYRQAAIVDPFSPDPWERLATIEFVKWRSAKEPQELDFDAAIAAQEKAIQRNPLNYMGYRTLGEFHLAHGRHTGRIEDRKAAASAFKTALSRYPHHAELLATAADAFLEAGEYESIATTVRRAIEQDDINHKAQHTDKWLTKEVRDRLEKMAEVPSPLPTPERE